MRDAGGGGTTPGNHPVSHGAYATAARDPNAERTPPSDRPPTDTRPATGTPAAHHRAPGLRVANRS